MRLAPALKRLLDLPEDQRRIGPFQLVEQLGRGGFAPVWLAREAYGSTELRLAAVKLFSVDGGGLTTATGGYHQRVIDEARSLCQVEHPNVVRFYSLAANDAGDVIGVAMEYLTGTPLDSRLAAGKHSLTEALNVGASVASALSAVHRAGLVHRDVKPANVIDSGGVYKLIDFGIAAAEAASRSPRATKPVLVDDLPLELSPAVKGRIVGAVTMRAATGSPGSGPGSAGGTPGYVDPVCQASGAPATPASDLYALGVVLFECVTGRHPAAISVAHGQGLDTLVLEGRRRAPSLSEVAPDAPASLCQLVDALLQPDPAQRPRSSEWVAIELERIRGELSGAQRKLPPESVGPFRGLGRFEEEDRDVYFGRSSEIAAGLELLRSHGTVALIGPSGSGKSSLARAGIVPRVVEGALGRWPSAWDAVVTVPTRDPRAAITSALGGLDGMTALREGMEPNQVVAALATRVQATGRGVLLVVDQLEELVTQSTGESGRWAAQLLGAIGEVPLPGVRALATARRDLFDPLLAMSGLGKTLVRGSLLVVPLDDATWSDVLTQALGAYGYALEDEALHDELMVQLKGTASAMPLVQFALTELWNKRDTTSKKVTRAGLREIGGIAGSLERHADATVTRLTRNYLGAGDLVRETLLALTTPQGTRATKPISALERPGEPDFRKMLEALEHARLVVVEADQVTLAHEALLTQWQQLRSWVAEVREDRLLVEEADVDARKWGATPEFVPLWKKRRLAMAEEVQRRGHVPFSATARTFLEASRRAERRARVIGVVVSAVAVLALGFGGARYVAAVQANEKTALEKAAVEEQKATLEQQKRLDLERAQLELDRRQGEIDRLLQKLSTGEDVGTVADVRRQLDEAQQGAKVARDRIAAALPRKPAAAPSTQPAATSAPTAVSATAPAPTIKVQREDD